MYLIFEGECTNTKLGFSSTQLKAYWLVKKRTRIEDSPTLFGQLSDVDNINVVGSLRAQFTRILV